MDLIKQIYQLYKKHHIVFTDSRKAKQGGIFFALKGDRFDGNEYALQAIADGADFAVVDRIDLANNTKCIYVDDVLKCLQQLANYHRRNLTIPILAITGTNGKTTTKELISAVLSQKFNVLATKGNLNNHIGVPLTLLEIGEQHQVAIVEMGANHQGEIEFLCKIAEPDFGLITNVGKAHLEGFGSFEGVMKTKAELYRFIESNGKSVFINSDNPFLSEMAGDKLNRLTYGVKNHLAQLKGNIASNDLFLVSKILFPKGWLYVKSNLTGDYNLENILAAARIGVHFNVDPILIQRGIELYQPTNNRSQILKKGSLTFIVDCYNANPSSMEVAINNFININKPDKVLILGDMLELGDNSFDEHNKVVEQIKLSDIKTVFLIGKFFQRINTPEHIIKFANVEELKQKVDMNSWEHKFILIKGSRGIQLEKIVSG